MRRLKIKRILSEKPEFELIKNDVFRISKRIRRIDRDYFIVFNHKTKRYEVHNVSNTGNSYCFVVPYSELDDRTLDYCKETLVENDIAVSMKEYNDIVAKSKEREKRNLLESTSLEFADRMSYAVDEDQLHQGYRKSHYINARN